MERILFMAIKMNKIFLLFVYLLICKKELCLIEGNLLGRWSREDFYSDRENELFLKFVKKLFDF